MPTEGKLRSLLSLNQIEYDDLLTVFAPLITKKLSHYTLKGQMRLFPLEEESPLSSLHGSKTKLDFILTYLKENPNQVRGFIILILAVYSVQKKSFLFYFAFF